jgi:hypothetical protein
MDSLLKVWTKALVGEDVDFALQQCFEVLAELDEIEQAASMIHFDKEIESLSGRASPRATDPKIRTLWAPCACARRSISGRLNLSKSAMPILHP